MASAVEGKALRITGANVRNTHIPVAPVRDLFPNDCFGGKNNAALGRLIEVTLDGVGTFETDIATDKCILRMRASDAVGRFYTLNGAIDGTRLFFEKTGARSFRVSVID